MCIRDRLRTEGTGNRVYCKHVNSADILICRELTKIPTVINVAESSKIKRYPSCKTLSRRVGAALMLSTCAADSAGKENALGTIDSLYLQRDGEDNRREILVVWYEPVRGQTGTLASLKASYPVVKL